MTRLTRRTAILAGGGAVVGLGAGAVILSRNWLGMTEETPAPIFARDGLAIRGIDPVAYFDGNGPVEGDARHAMDWKGVEWRFASAENRERFATNPGAFAPRYGGFCAWAVAVKGELYSTQPENWSIVEGRLYLNYNNAVQEKWEAGIPRFIAEADRRWPGLMAKS